MRVSPTADVDAGVVEDDLAFGQVDLVAVHPELGRRRRHHLGHDVVVGGNGFGALPNYIMTDDYGLFKLAWQAKGLKTPF